MRMDCKSKRGGSKSRCMLNLQPFLPGICWLQLCLGSQHKMHKFLQMPCVKLPFTVRPQPVLARWISCFRLLSLFFLYFAFLSFALPCLALLCYLVVLKCPMFCNHIPYALKTTLSAEIADDIFTAESGLFEDHCIKFHMHSHLMLGVEEHIGRSHDCCKWNCQNFDFK